MHKAVTYMSQPQIGFHNLIDFILKINKQMHGLPSHKSTSASSDSYMLFQYRQKLGCPVTIRALIWGIAMPIFKHKCGPTVASGTDHGFKVMPVFIMCIARRLETLYLYSIRTCKKNS